MIDKRIMAYKSVAILLILSYIATSFFPCVETNIWRCISGENASTTSYSNNLSAFMLVALALQIALLFLNRPYLQMIAGIIGMLSGILLPLTVFVMSIVDDAVSIIGSHTERAITPLGWIVTTFSWVLVVFDIWFAVVIRRYNASTASLVENNAEERDDVT